MNSRKCCYTIFSKNGNKNKINFKLKLSDGEIPYNPKPVFLGIIFDEYLCFNEHYKMLETRAIKRLNIISISYFTIMIEKKSSNFLILIFFSIRLKVF